MFRLNFLRSVAVLVCCGIAHHASAQVNVLTYHNDNGRTGQNTNETILTLANVNQSTFGKLFAYSVDGFVYAQPLIVCGVNISGQGTHNVIFVATEHNTVYAFDADSNTGVNGGLLWKTNLGPSAPCPVTAFEFTPIQPEVGITGTPVIDLASQTLYVDTFIQVGSTFSHKLHALAITNGAERSFSPVTVTASVPGVGAGSSGGVQTFQPGQELQRGALTLVNGILYVAYAGYTDILDTDPNHQTDPFHGWVIGFNPPNLQQLPPYTFNTTPNGTTGQFGTIAGEGGIWMGGGGVAADAGNNLYFTTGDGNFNACNGCGGTEYGSSFLKLSTSGGLSVADYFTSFNQAFYRTNDLDVGSGGVMLIPDQPGPFPHLLTGAGKPGTMYLINRDQFTAGNNHYNSGGSSDAVLQTFQLAGGCFSTAAYFNGQIYFGAWQDHIVAFALTNGTIPTFPTQVGSRLLNSFPGLTPSVSANGTNNGIIWGIQRSNSPVLFACKATNITAEIYNSYQAAGNRDQLIGAVKFAVPTIANGKVYVGTSNAVSVFGILAGGLQFSSPTYSIQEDAGTATITVNRAGGNHGAVQVNYATVAGGTATAGQDYTSTSGTLNWADGDSTPKNFNVTILNNQQAGSDKTVFLALSSPTGGAYVGSPSNAVLTITTVQNSYSVWKSSHFGANANNPSIAGNLADPDGDGIPNVLEYAFGSDPNASDATQPLTGSIVSNHFQFQFNRNTSATDLTYTAQVAASLNTSWSNLMTYLSGTGWVTNTPGTTVTESAPTGSPPDQHVQVTITDPVNTGNPAATNRFFQLKVQQ